MCVGDHDFIPAANVVQVTVVYDQFGQKMMNVYNVLSGAGHVEADLDRIKAKILTWLTNNLKGEQHNTSSTSLILAKSLDSEGDIAKEYVVTPALTGTQGNTALPGGTTVCVKWSTGLAGRSYRGRTFHIGLSSVHINGNQLGTSAQTFITAAYNALLPILAGGGTVDKLVVVSYCHLSTWRTSAVVTPITGASVDINLDSQRRRLTGRGS
jgi:hypothetical protein